MGASQSSKGDDPVRDPVAVKLGSKITADNLVTLIILYKNQRKLCLSTPLSVASQIQLEFRRYLNTRNPPEGKKRTPVEEAIAFIGDEVPEYFITIDASAVDTIYVDEAFIQDGTESTE